MLEKSYITLELPAVLEMLAAQAEGDERNALVEQAVKKDVRYMNYVLDTKQYKMYLQLLNATLLNRGLR